MVRFWKHENKVFNSKGIALDPVSPARAMEKGWGLDYALLSRNADAEGWNDLLREDLLDGVETVGAQQLTRTLRVVVEIDLEACPQRECQRLHGRGRGDQA